ncbi:MAG: magnesium-transporting ATPase, partial [Spirulina sp. DLM2.Bin59]
MPPLPDLSQPWYAQSVDDTLMSLKSDRQGLTSPVVEQHRLYYGPNEIIEAQGRNRWQILLDQFSNIMLVMLMGVALVSGILDFLALRNGEGVDVPFKDTIAILAIVILNGILGYVQEMRADLVKTRAGPVADPVGLGD